MKTKDDELNSKIDSTKNDLLDKIDKLKTDTVDKYLLKDIYAAN